MSWQGEVAGYACFAICIFVIAQCTIAENKTTDKTDYQACIDKCPTSHDGFKGLECPRMCAELNTNTTTQECAEK